MSISRYHSLHAHLIAIACAMAAGCAQNAPVENAAVTADNQPAVESIPADKPPATKHLSVVLISIDTLRPDHLGCYGYARPTSPNIDRLAGQAVRFANCRSQAPWTLSSHMSLFTSMLPSSNGVDNLNKVLPAQFATLAELLSAAGYQTLGFVNDAQMKSHWGFSRGFHEWIEYEVDTPSGDCEHITAKAIEWLGSRSAPEPFFLFLHYYDPHDPYAAPAEFREQFGTTLAGHRAREICFAHRTPAVNVADPQMLDDVIAAYDAEIAWVDRELGKLLAAIPPDAVVILLSDHGESFEEHGWMLHGATLYEEELRVPLVMRLPGDPPQTATVDQPVMLLDVAPTILELCNVRVPLQFQGRNLAPLWRGESLEPRLLPAESKAVLEGRVLLSATLYPWKGIYSVLDGRFELFKLPDEQHPLQGTEAAAAEAIRKPLADWIAGDSFWMIHAHGKGDFEATIMLETGRFGTLIPVGMDPQRDRLEVLDDGRAIRWRAYPGGGVKSLFVQPADPATALDVDFQVNGERATKQVFLGASGQHPVKLPATVPSDADWVNPVITAPFSATGDGFHVLHHRARTDGAQPSRVEPLDRATIERLRSLGYLP